MNWRNGLSDFVMPAQAGIRFRAVAGGVNPAPMSTGSEAAGLTGARAPANLVGILCALGAAVIFSVNDLLIKFLSGDYPLHEITFFRSLVAVVVIGLVFVPLEGGWRILKSKRWRLHLIRAAVVIAANMTYYAGLAALPLGEATSIYFVAPLIITLLSSLVLGERIGPRRVAAVLVGLAGVIVVIRPGMAAFQAAALLPLAAAFFYAWVQILTRKLGMAEKAAAMTFHMNAIFIAFSGGFGMLFGSGRYAGWESRSIEFLTRAWIWPAPGDWPMLIAIGVLVAVGAWMVAVAYRSCEAAVVAPFEYAALPMAIMFSIVFWGEWPDAVAWIGIAMIAGSGLFIIMREASLGRSLRLRRPVPPSK